MDMHMLHQQWSISFIFCEKLNHLLALTFTPFRQSGRRQLSRLRNSCLPAVSLVNGSTPGTLVRTLSSTMPSQNSARRASSACISSHICSMDSTRSVNHVLDCHGPCTAFNMTRALVQTEPNPDENIACFTSFHARWYGSLSQVANNSRPRHAHKRQLRFTECSSQ
eukprot:6255395-Amphidinium_carterae.2